MIQLKFVLLVVLVYAIGFLLSGQNNAPIIGEASIASNTIGHNAMFGNPAGLAKEEHVHASVNYTQHHSLRELDEKNAAFSRSKNGFAYGFLTSNSGDERFRQNIFDLALSRRFDPRLDIGIKLRIVHSSFSDVYGSRTFFHSELGLNSDVSKSIHLSFFASNPSRRIFVESIREAWPWKYGVGLRWNITKSLILNTAIEKRSQHDLDLKMALSKQLSEHISLLAGYQSLLRSYSIGLQSCYMKMMLGISSTYNWQHGFSPSLTLSYKIED